ATVAAPGAVSRYSTTTGTLPLPGCTTMKPPPPMLPACGYVTASANAVATLASTALPPRLRMSKPAFDAGAETETTTPFLPLASWDWANITPDGETKPSQKPVTKMAISAVLLLCELLIFAIACRVLQEIGEFGLGKNASLNCAEYRDLPV